MVNEVVGCGGIMCLPLPKVMDPSHCARKNILFIATTYNWPLRRGGCSNCPMQLKAEGEHHGIEAGIM